MPSPKLLDQVRDRPRLLMAFGIDNEEGRPTVPLPFGSGAK